jgi:hypothetical protein
MSDPFKPSVGLLAKLGSICQHVDEVAGEDGHAFDWAAIRSLLEDREVTAWLDQMHKHALLPVRRIPASVSGVKQP